MREAAQLAIERAAACSSCGALPTPQPRGQGATARPPRTRAAGDHPPSPAAQPPPTLPAPGAPSSQTSSRGVRKFCGLGRHVKSHGLPVCARHPQARRGRGPCFEAAGERGVTRCQISAQRAAPWRTCPYFSSNRRQQDSKIRRLSILVSAAGYECSGQEEVRSQARGAAWGQSSGPTGPRTRLEPPRDRPFAQSRQPARPSQVGAR